MLQALRRIGRTIALGAAALVSCLISRGFAASAADLSGLVDFPGLQHYAAANAALPTSSSGRRVVFMGDSITEFWGTLDPEFFSNADYVNRGISGQTTQQMLLRFSQDVVALKPAVVHLMAGTNDIAGNTGEMSLADTEANIASMADIAKAHHIAVVLGSVLPAADFPWRRGRDPGPKVAALNRWLALYAQSNGMTYADYHSSVSDGHLGMRHELSPDGVHPSRRGYLVMDPIAKRAIDAAR